MTKDNGRKPETDPEAPEPGETTDEDDRANDE